MPRVVGGDIARCPVLGCGELVERDGGVKACWRMYVGAASLRGERRFALDVAEMVGRSPVSRVMVVIAGSEERTEGARGTRLEEVTTGEITSPGDDPSLGNGAE